MQIMDLIANGSIDVNADVIPQTTKYREAVSASLALQGQLRVKLEPSLFTLVEDYSEQRSIAEGILATEAFKYGLAVGLRLMQESHELGYLLTKEPDRP